MVVMDLGGRVEEQIQLEGETCQHLGKQVEDLFALVGILLVTPLD